MPATDLPGSEAVVQKEPDVRGRYGGRFVEEQAHSLKVVQVGIPYGGDQSKRDDLHHCAVPAIHRSERDVAAAAPDPHLDLHDVVGCVADMPRSPPEPRAC